MNDELAITEFQPRLLRRTVDNQTRAARIRPEYHRRRFRFRRHREWDLISILLYLRSLLGFRAAGETHDRREYNASHDEISQGSRRTRAAHHFSAATAASPLSTLRVGRFDRATIPMRPESARLP